jgi:hypothetical protein
MKVQSTRHRNIKVRLGNETVSFDGNGVAEVSQQAFDMYKSDGWLFEHGKVPTKVEATRDKAVDTAQVNALMLEVGRLKGIIEDKDKEIASLKASESEWRQKVEELLQGSVVKAEVDPAVELEQTLKNMHYSKIPAFLRSQGIEDFPETATKAELIAIAMKAFNQ